KSFVVAMVLLSEAICVGLSERLRNFELEAHPTKAIVDWRHSSLVGYGTNFIAFISLAVGFNFLEELSQYTTFFFVHRRRESSESRGSAHQTTSTFAAPLNVS